MSDERKDYIMNLATEMLHEIKMTARRWFIAFLVMCVLEIFTVAGFLIYMRNVTEETAETSTTVEQESDNNSMNIGGDYNGISTDNQEDN